MVSPFVMQVVPIIRFMQYLDDWYKRGVKGFYPSPVSFQTIRTVQSKQTIRTMVWVGRQPVLERGYIILDK